MGLRKQTVEGHLKTHLKEAKSSWAELIFPLSVLQRQILDELIYELLV